MLSRRAIVGSREFPLYSSFRLVQYPEDIFNRILWNAMKEGKEPYPQWAVISNLDDAIREMEK